MRPLPILPLLWQVLVLLQTLAEHPPALTPGRLHRLATPALARARRLYRASAATGEPGRGGGEGQRVATVERGEDGAG